MKLVKQKKISPRKMWPNEAQDFTPWLEQHIDELGEQIGFDLEVVGREVSVGPYSADLLAKDNNTNTFVVIENQLEKTNHDHLGKTITYASALDAKTIVWIATDITEEHKKALDWLNDITQEDISFYGIQLELWEVGPDTASTRWNIVSAPSVNVKAIKHASSTTESGQIQLSYWTKFRDKLKATKKIHSLHTPRPQYWFDVALGKSGIHISNTCNIQKNIVRIRVYIENKTAPTAYAFLESRKADIEKQLGFQMNWDSNPNASDKTITLEHETDLTDEVKTEESLNWMVDYTIKVWNVFSNVLKEMK